MGLVFLTATFFTSCSDDANDSTIDQELTQTEVQTIVEIDAITTSVDNVLSELYTFGNDASKTTQKANECYAAEYTENGFTATFNNCALNGTDNVNGTLNVTYTVNGNTAGFSATYTDFYVGEVKIDGTRAYVIEFDESTNEVALVITSDISLEMADGSIIAESGTKTLLFGFDETLEELTFAITGDWTVQADGNTYQVTTISPLQIEGICDYFTSGSMQISKNGLEVIVDFGDGTCDALATLTYPNGTTEDITL